MGQRRYVLLFLWMAAQGGGVVPGKTLANAARRLRVTCAPRTDACNIAVLAFVPCEQDSVCEDMLCHLCLVADEKTEI